MAHSAAAVIDLAAPQLPRRGERKRRSQPPAVEWAAEVYRHETDPYQLSSTMLASNPQVDRRLESDAGSARVKDDVVLRRNIAGFGEFTPSVG